MNTIALNRNDGSSLHLQVIHGIEQEQAYIIAGQDKYTSLHALLAALPEIGGDQHRDACCEICMRLHGGARYQRIEDPDAFRTAYQALLEHGHAGTDLLPTAADFGPFDVTEIGAPQICDSTLVFYVKDIRFGVPYRVQVPWLPTPDMTVRFQLLPLLD